jgi:hypothetical protein
MRLARGEGGLFVREAVARVLEPDAGVEIGSVRSERGCRKKVPVAAKGAVLFTRRFSPAA